MNIIYALRGFELTKYQMNPIKWNASRHIDKLKVPMAVEWLDDGNKWAIYFHSKY